MRSGRVSEARRVARTGRTGRTGASGRLRAIGLVAGFPAAAVAIAVAALATLSDRVDGPGAWGIKAGIAKFGPVTAAIQDLDIQGLLTLPNLSISIAAAGASCPAPPTPTGAPS